MIRKCTNCTIPIDVTNPKTKYCKPCAIIVQKEQSNNWLRGNRKKDYDLFCLECGDTLPSLQGGKKYCDLCANERNKSKRRQSMKNQKMRIKLDKFYKNLRINLIQSPYLVEIKTLNKIILLENK